MVRMWERSTSRRVNVAVLSRFSTNTTLEATILGKILVAVGPDASVVSMRRRSACSGTGLCKLLGKWVPFQARGVPHIRSPTDEALPPADCCVCVWEPGPVFNDGICGEPLKGRRDSGLDGVSSSVAKSHHYTQPLYARPSRCGGEYCWGMASSGIIPERVLPQR